MEENYAENENIIGAEDVKLIDLHQVESIHLVDGTVVLVQDEEERREGQENGNNVIEHHICTLDENYNKRFENDQSNQLRGRPMMGKMGRMVHPMGPKPVFSPVGPMKPALVKPMMVPRGPVRTTMPMGGVVFRARPGGFGGYGQQGGFGRQGGFGQQGGFGRQGFGGGFGQQGGFGGQFRARPRLEEEQEGDFQEEEYAGEEEYYML